jgi:hypothetical protein
MPNYCANKATFTHHSQTHIEAVKVAVEAGNLFRTFAPIDMTTEAVADETNGVFVGLQTSAWGTKWDICDGYVVNVEEGLIEITFDTAWAPPIGFYDTMMELGFGVDATYHEPGMAFCGYWVDGSDDEYDYDETLDVPQYVIDDFNLDEQYCDMEE